ncbi:MAG: hypothetical protein AB7F49_08970 [Pseudorhodoplanes sp.]
MTIDESLAQTPKTKSCPSDTSIWSEPASCGPYPCPANGPCSWGPKQQAWEHCDRQRDKAIAKVREHNNAVKRCGYAGAASASSSKARQVNNRTSARTHGNSASPPLTQKKAAPKVDLDMALKHASDRAKGSEEKNAQQTSALKANHQNNVQAGRSLYEKKKAEAEEAARYREQVRREAARIEAERTARQLAEARKWRCYGEVGSVRQGFNECRAECGNYFNANYCASTCRASEASLENGRSCFKIP